MKGSVKSVGVATAFLLVFLWAVSSRYVFMVVAVGDLSQGNVSPVLEDSIVILRKVGPAEDLVGMRVGFWWQVASSSPNQVVGRPVLG